MNMKLEDFGQLFDSTEKIWENVGKFGQKMHTETVDNFNSYLGQVHNLSEQTLKAQKEMMTLCQNNISDSYNMWKTTLKSFTE